MAENTCTNLLLIITNRFGKYSPNSLLHYANALGYDTFIELPSNYAGPIPEYAGYACYDLLPIDLLNTHLAKIL